MLGGPDDSITYDSSKPECIFSLSLRVLFALFTCTSFCGFQSESSRMHVSAAVKLIPSPPARVERRKMKVSELGLQNRSMAACRRSPRMVPSSRSCEYLRSSRYSEMRSSIRTICEKMSTRWPSLRSFGSSLSSRTHLPLAASIAVSAALPLVEDSPSAPSAADGTAAPASTPLINRTDHATNKYLAVAYGQRAQPGAGRPSGRDGEG
eukprot:scaffold141924_cov23-Tisochrysis_lutea.AAC.3